MAGQAQRLVEVISQAVGGEQTFVVAIDGRSGSGKSTLAAAVAGLLGNQPAWFGYDWEAFDGSLLTTPTVVDPAPVIILEGAYSCRPELTNVIHLKVLLEADLDVRRRRLRVRDGDEWHEAWFDRWDEAERYYFGEVMTRNGFDLVLSGGTDVS